MKLFRLQAPSDERLLARATFASKRISCPQNSGHQRAGQRLSDLSATVISPAALRDVIFGWTPVYLARNNVLEALRTAGLTGFAIRPVSLSVEGGKQASVDHAELAVTGFGGCGIACPSMQLVDYCEHCGLVKLAYAGDPPWNFGALEAQAPFDFFKLAPFGQTFVSERAADVIHGLDVQGLALRSADEGLGHDIAVQRSTMAEPPDWLDARQLAVLWRQVQDFDRIGLLTGKAPPAWAALPD